MADLAELSVITYCYQTNARPTFYDFRLLIENKYGKILVILKKLEFRCYQMLLDMYQVMKQT